MADEKTEGSIEVIRAKCDCEGYFEFLENVIAQAQDEGSIISIITIMPSKEDIGGEDKGCKPGDEQCKKCK